MADGLPLFEEILARYGGESAREAVDLLFSERIQGTRHVLRIIRYQSHFDVNTRLYSAECVIDTDFGGLELVIP